MTLGEQIKQGQRRWRICIFVGILMWLPPGLAAALKGAGSADPGDAWPFLVLLVLAGGILLIVGAIGQWSLRCPKCRGLLGTLGDISGRFCRHCGVDFHTEA